MSMRNKKLDMPYSQIDDVQEYVEAFDLETGEIDFNIIDEYKESPYALDASTLNSINDDVNIMQNNWYEDIDETLDDKAELFQSWIDNLGEEVRPWNNVAIDKSPYLYRRSANGSLDYPFDREIDKIIGGTVAWNQKVPTPTTWNVATKAFTSGEVFVKNHKYLAIFMATKIDAQGNNPAVFLYANVNGSSVFTDNAFGIGSRIWNCSENATADGSISGSNSIWIYINNYSNANIESVNFIDLTALFGSAEIADYVYSIEQTTTGAGVAWLKSHGFLTKDYYTYDSGSLLSVKTSEHRTSGKNLLRNSASTLTTNGITFTVYDDGSVNVNGTATANAFLEMANLYMLPAGTYIVSGSTDSNAVIFVRETNAAGAQLAASPSGTTQFTRDGSKAIGVVLRVPSGATLNNVKIYPMIRFASVSDATFEPYHINSYPLDSDLELRGLFKLDANNNLYAEGDVYESSGAVTRKYGYRAYQSGDESLADAITDGTNTVYKLTTPSTETADPYDNPQVVNPLGTEEYVDTRDVPVPVGHETRYLNNDLYYYKNDIVTYSEDVGAMFLCLQDCDGSQPLPTALTVVNDYWLRVYDKGKPGLSVYNLTDKGKFNWQNNYVVNDVVWMDERHINFYVCINNVSYTINNTPNYDSAHWVKLFTVYRDGVPVYWEMPNQNFFNDAHSPSVFGVAQGTSLNFDSIDVLNNITNITEEDSSLRLLENETILLTIYKQDGNAYNSTPILHCGTLINVPLIESGVIYKIPLNFLFYNMHMGLLCIHEEGVGASFILTKLDNNDNVYYDIDGYIDENYFVYNKAQYESLFPNVPYIKIEFNKHASEIPILIRLINRIQTQDINNPQYIKLKTSSDAIVKEDNIVLITLNDLINDLIEENNI